MTDDPFERAVERVEHQAEERAAGRRARRRERSARGQRLGFRIHATVFLSVQLLLVAIWGVIWLTGGSGYPWFIFPLVGWGVGLAVHYAVAYEHLGARFGRPGEDRPTHE